MRWKTTLSVALAVATMASTNLPSVYATRLEWQALSDGGSEASSGAHKLSSTVGLTVTQPGSSGAHTMIHGYQQNFGVAPPPCNRCGDANDNGTLNISDAVYLIAYIFAGGSPPGDCGVPRGLGDADGNGIVNISDVVAIIAYIFAGGSLPHCS